MSKDVYKCSDCKKLLPITDFRPAESSYIKKDGTVVHYSNRRSYCMVCESKRGAQARAKKEFARAYKGYQSNVVVSLRTVLHMVKKELHREDSPQMKYCWAKVGKTLNDLIPPHV